MKRLLFILLLCLPAACSSIPETIEAQQESYGFDFRPYTQQGFLFSPGDYPGQYDAIGLVTYVMWPRVQRVERGGGYTWEQDDVPEDEAIRNAYEKARSMGADALTHFNISSVERYQSGIRITGLEVRGYAIKRR